jgi:hypothetical protein
LSLEVRAGGHGEHSGIRVVTGSDTTISGGRLAYGPIELRLSTPTDDMEQRSTPVGPEVRIRCRDRELVAVLSIATPSVVGR